MGPAAATDLLEPATASGDRLAQSVAPLASLAPLAPVTSLPFGYLLRCRERQSALRKGGYRPFAKTRDPKELEGDTF